MDQDQDQYQEYSSLVNKARKEYKFCEHSYFINVYVWKDEKFNTSINTNDIEPCFELDNRSYHIEYIQNTIN
ncbi:MAG: hypothetical protein HeimC3_26050 [Candidatus Heimdallarchaeota archaeon LC_3]|nr:MAG: hypothetical protein HeimC3_26050 [Candidatus Heimdallarchaeota archaeon LC_3]